MRIIHPTGSINHQRRDKVMNKNWQSYDSGHSAIQISDTANVSPYSIPPKR